MPTQLALVLFDRTPVIDADRLRKELAAHWPALAQPTEIESGDGSQTFTMEEIIVGIGLMPAPMPWGDLEAPCKESKLWSGAADALRGHAEHAIVSVIGETSQVALATALTRVTAAILLTCREAVGVFWGAARLIVPPEVFRRAAVELLLIEPPVMIWIDFQIGWREYQVNSAGYTRGLTQFGLCEFEALDAPEKPSALRSRVERLAIYQLKSGGPIRDGDTFEQKAGERIRLIGVESTFGVEGPVMRLVFDA